MSNLNKETVLIVGGSSSVGADIATLFHSKQMRVITTHMSEPHLDEMSNVNSFHLDLRNDNSIRDFSGRIKDELSKIDVVIFLAGILPGQELGSYDFATIDKVMSVNFNGQAKLIMNILPMLTSRSRLLLFSSISAQRGSFDPIYAASKGALLSLVKSLAKSLPRGCRINSIAPGLIQDSKMYQNMTIELQEHHRNQVFSKKLLSSKDLAKIVFDLCQPLWAHLNGACIDLNGGQHAR